MRGKILQFAILLLVALGAGPVGAAMWQWSKTAGPNDSADPSINWREGMAPSSVNDSARAMMAAMAQYRDDISGLLATAGTSTAYTVTTNQGLASVPNDGQLIAVTVHATNGVSPTLRADGGTIYPIQSSPGVGVASATMILGSPYSLKFSSANSAWMLHGFYASPTNIALGAIIPFTLTTSPNSNFVFPYGQCLSTTTYAAYWTALGSPASGSCPGGQFAIIDMRGRVPAALDTLPGSAAANRLTSAATGCGVAFTTVGAVCTESQSTTLGAGNLPPYTPQGNIGIDQLDVVRAASLTPFTPNAIGVGSLVAPSAGSSNITGLTGNFNGITDSGTSIPFSRVQPTIGLTYLLRVL